MPDDAELAGRLERLTLEQKVRLLTGADIWALHPLPEIGLRRLVTSDGPAGVRGERWDERSPSANVPSPTALAASWDEARVERIGALLASEARRKGVDILLAPTVNLHRSPYGGRHFECLSEDPLLTGRIGAAYVRGVQSGGVAATVKHFVANDSETERFTVDVQVEDRPLRELYLAPFETIVRDAGPWAVMAAYNRLHGTTMTESPLLRDVLKGEWAFDGVVISDWHAARSLAAAGEGLLDLAMPGPDGPWGDALLAAVRDGTIPEAALDGHVMRVLRVAARVGALEGIAPTVPAPAPWSEDAVADELRAAAAAGFVLARNPSRLLPLDGDELATVAVIGPSAAAARTLGGGSATVFPAHVVSPLAGLRDALPDATVHHAVGCRATERLPAAPPNALRLPGGQGVEVRFFDAAGSEIHREERRIASWLWWGPIADGVDAGDVARVEVHTTLRAGVDGPHLIGASAVGDIALSIDGEPRLEQTVTLAEGADVVEGITRPPQAHVELALGAGQEIPVVLSYLPRGGGILGGAATAMLVLQLNFTPRIDDATALREAVELAARADVAIVVVGTNDEIESEGFDRDDLALPHAQTALVEAVAEVNPRTVVVVNSGAPVLLPWVDRVGAVLLAWFPGQEFGAALADVLLGRTEPGGRLPTTWPGSETGLPAVTPSGGELHYDEGLFIGYRAFDRDGGEPLFPFGHGLGYTSWALGELSVPPATDVDTAVLASIEVENTGTRSGREVVQLYASKPDGAVERPPRWLVGYGAVSAGPGERARIDIEVSPRALAHWDGGGWAVEPGEWVLEAGRSSRELSARAAFTLR